MAQGGWSWWSVVLVVVLVAVMVVPTGALSSRSNTKALKATPYQTGYGAHETVNGPSVVIPSTSGPGNVNWTLCLSNGQLLSGNAACPSNGLKAVGIARDPSNGYLYVANGGSKNVSVINGATDKVVGSVSVGISPSGVAYDSANGDIYVTNWGSNNMSVINGATDTVVGSILVGSNPIGVAYDSANGYLYVADGISNTVSVINGATDTVVGSIPVGSYPEGVAYDSANGYLYVANYGSNNVSVINGATDTVVGSILVGSNPIEVAYDSANGYLYVTNSGSNTVIVINGATDAGAGSIPVGSSPEYVTYDSANGYLYVTNWNSNNVSVINGATDTVVGSIPVGSYPEGVAYDSANGYLYVTNEGSGSVSIITTGPASSAYPVSFSESGLAAGTSWYVTLSGQILASTTNTITFNEPNGTHNFTISNVPGYSAAPSSGFVTVNGVSQTRAIAFTLIPPKKYAVTFTESGLPSGTSWSVTFNGATQSSTVSIVFNNYLNGTYNFTVGSVAGYSANSSSGSVTLSGANKTQTITFTPLPPGRYSVTFTESGLPTGMSWSVTFNGSTLSSTTTSIVFSNYLNNTYAYSVGVVSGYNATPSSSSVTINGASKTVPITFTKSGTGITYSVTFGESGLPSGTSWSVTLNGTTKTGAGNIAFTEPNGIYPFSVGAIAGYSASPSSGTIKVNGIAVSQSIVFTKAATTSPGLFRLPGNTGYIPIAVLIAVVATVMAILLLRKRTGATYTVTFTETGLPSGTNWSMILKGTTRSSTTSTITFKEANGSYTFSIGSVSGYTVSPTSGSVKVNGGPTNQSVTFTKSK